MYPSDELVCQTGWAVNEAVDRFCRINRVDVVEAKFVIDGVEFAVSRPRKDGADEWTALQPKPKPESKGKKSDTATVEPVTAAESASQ